jgi:hypothetical protein
VAGVRGITNLVRECRQREANYRYSRVGRESSDQVIAVIGLPVGSRTKCHTGGRAISCNDPLRLRHQKGLWVGFNEDARSQERMRLESTTADRSFNRAGSALEDGTLGR